MENLNFVIGKNLQALRKKNGLTQSQIAEKFNYSDKAVSKWENGESLPPIDVFYKLAKFYNVNIDFIVSEREIKPREIEKINTKKIYRYITLLSVLSVWLAALITFVFLHIFSGVWYWRCFIWAVPISFIVGIVFDSMWGRCKWLFLLITGLVWSLLLCIAVQLLHFKIWEILLIGIPVQIGIIICAKMLKK